MSTPHAASHVAHPDSYYVKIWAMLCALLVVSVIGPMVGIRVLTLITAFGIAIIKAYLVTRHFMHLDIEKRWVSYILVAMLAFMVVLFGGFSPDIMKHTGQRWNKTYVEPQVTRGE
jgi:caa(3)-type oxidase subunit IV